MKTIFRIILFLLLTYGALHAQVTSTNGTFSTGSATTNLSLRTGTTTRVTVLATNGFTGINTTTPSTQFDINGALRIRSLPTNVSLTQILVADGSGNVRRRGIFPFTVLSSSLGIGTNALPSNTGTWNIALGTSALASNTTGQSNTAIGYEALLSNTTSSYNTAVGFQALFFTSSYSNTAVGYRAGFGNTGQQLTAIGYRACYANNNFFGMNTAVGYESMFSTTDGIYNTAVGQNSLYSNTTGLDNVAIGSEAMQYNVTGNHNTACGYMALNSNETASDNTAIGDGALLFNTTGESNTAVGGNALFFNNTGAENTALGYQAGSYSASRNLNNTVSVGAFTTATASNHVRIGNAAMTSIGGQVSWSTLSDGRFKQDLKEDVPGIEFIKQLRPVSYTVDIASQEKFLGIKRNEKSVPLPEKTLRQSGFVAQEVEKIVQDSKFAFYGVDAPANEQSHYSLRYSEFVVPLVKAVQELSAKVDLQAAEISKLQEQLASSSSARSSTSIRDDAMQIQLYQNAPNPFDRQTSIAVYLPDAVQDADVMIYNLEGKQLKRMPVTTRGEAKVQLSGSELPAGMYIYALVADGQIIDTKRMMLTK